MLTIWYLNMKIPSWLSDSFTGLWFIAIKSKCAMGLGSRAFKPDTSTVVAWWPSMPLIGRSTDRTVLGSCSCFQGQIRRRIYIYQKWGKWWRFWPTPYVYKNLINDVVFQLTDSSFSSSAYFDWPVDLRVKLNLLLTSAIFANLWKRSSTVS